MAQEPLILPAGLDAVQQDGIRRAVCGMAADQAQRAKRAGSGTAKNEGAGAGEKQQREQLRALAGDIAGLESLSALGGAADWSTVQLQALKQQYQTMAGREWGRCAGPGG